MKPSALLQLIHARVKSLTTVTKGIQDMSTNPPRGSTLSMSNGCMYVDGKPFVVEYPDEPIKCVDDNKLVTVFRGHLTNYWSHEDIEGYYA